MCICIYINIYIYIYIYIYRERKREREREIERYTHIYIIRCSAEVLYAAKTRQPGVEGDAPPSEDNRPVSITGATSGVCNHFCGYYYEYY